jgi:hypothetical protein
MSTLVVTPPAPRYAARQHQPRTATFGPVPADAFGAREGDVAPNWSN